MPPTSALVRLPSTPLHRIAPLALAILFTLTPTLHAQSPTPDPDQIPLAPVIQKLLDDPITTEPQRRQLAIFHGQYDRIQDPTPTEQATIALHRYDLNHPTLLNEKTPAHLRATAALRRGHPQQTLDLLQPPNPATTPTPQTTLLRARAHLTLGQTRDALDTLTPIRTHLTNNTLTTAPDLTAAAQALSLLATLEARPARDYQLAMSLLGRAHSQLDQLHWPAKLAEAQLLYEKDNAPEAKTALLETLALNPNASRAWFLLGQLAADSYNFDLAARCAAQLRNINPDHPLADTLDADSFLRQKDTASALAAIEAGLSRYPDHRQLIARLAAAEALADSPLNPTNPAATFARFDRLSPGRALAHYTAGKYLALARRYPAAARYLATATEREPNWPAPRIELGLLHMQAGDEHAAAATLAHAARLDPFNRQAKNQLALAKDLLNYEQIRTEHFIIKFQPGIDRALAADMPEHIEKIHRRLTTTFNHTPKNKTLIEILPDERAFAVRITGLPEIWTIAACTGDVIAMTPPRTGPTQRGAFDWLRVIEHELVHTITLDQTDYRIPHWFTEACAVSQEQSPRSFADCQLLAWALHHDKLFDLTAINWAFVRPKTPRDRPLAYAQSAWILQYITETHSHNAVLQMLERFRLGDDSLDAITHATNQSHDAFMRTFKQWAHQQVRAWGLHPQPPNAEIENFLTTTADPESTTTPLLEQRARATDLLSQNPTHPDLLKRAAELEIKLLLTTPPVGWVERSETHHPNPNNSDTPAEKRGRESLFPPVITDNPRAIADSPTTAPRSGATGGLPATAPPPGATAGLPSSATDQRHPNTSNPHPDTTRAQRATLRYAHARPTDPWPHEQLAAIALRTHNPDAAVAPLQQLDLLEQQTGDWSHQLALIHRAANRLDLAANAIARAVQREPYNANYRELAATLALQNNNPTRALHHITAAATLEPTRAIHQTRLAALHHRLGNPTQSTTAAKKARDLNPNAPVQKFLPNE